MGKAVQVSLKNEPKVNSFLLVPAFSKFSSSIIDSSYLKAINCNWEWSGM
jgi:hypothetical protein